MLNPTERANSYTGHLVSDIGFEEYGVLDFKLPELVHQSVHLKPTCLQTAHIITLIVPFLEDDGI